MCYLFNAPKSREIHVKRIFKLRISLLSTTITSAMRLKQITLFVATCETRNRSIPARCLTSSSKWFSSSVPKRDLSSENSREFNFRMISNKLAQEITRQKNFIILMPNKRLAQFKNIKATLCILKHLAFASA